MSFDLRVAAHPATPPEGCWHLLRSTDNGPEFAISPGAWREQRRSLADTVGPAGDDLSIYEQVSARWTDWLERRLRDGGQTLSDLAYDPALMAAAGQALDSAWPAEWRERHALDPSLASHMIKYRVRHPDGMRDFARTLPAGRRDRRLWAWETQEFRETFERGPGGWIEREPALERGDWPDDVAIVQTSGPTRWRRFMAGGWLHGHHPALVDNVFLDVLRDTDATGWLAKRLDIRGRDWTPRDSHQGLFVLERLAFGRYTDDVQAPWPEAPAFFARLYAADTLRARAETTLRMSEQGICASPPLAAALARAKLSGLTLEPLLYEIQVPEEFREPRHELDERGRSSGGDVT